MRGTRYKYIDLDSAEVAEKLDELLMSRVVEGLVRGLEEEGEGDGLDDGVGREGVGREADVGALPTTHA